MTVTDLLHGELAVYLTIGLIFAAMNAGRYHLEYLDENGNVMWGVLLCVCLVMLLGWLVVAVYGLAAGILEDDSPLCEEYHEDEE